MIFIGLTKNVQWIRTIPVGKLHIILYWAQYFDKTKVKFYCTVYCVIIIKCFVIIYTRLILTWSNCVHHDYVRWNHRLSQPTIDFYLTHFSICKVIKYLYGKLSTKRVCVCVCVLNAVTVISNSKCLGESELELTIKEFNTRY